MAANGEPIPLIRVGKKGRIRFAFGDMDEKDAFVVDVIKIQNEWIVLDRQLRDPEGELPPEQIVEWQKALWQFVSGLHIGEERTVGSVYPELSEAECLEFINRINEECDTLRPFFEPRSRGEPCSPASFTPRFTT